MNIKMIVDNIKLYYADILSKINLSPVKASTGTVY